MKNRCSLNDGWELVYTSNAFNWICEHSGIFVDLPHDHMIGLETGEKIESGGSGAFYPGCVVGYEKNLFAPEEWRGKHVYIEADGIYHNTTVTCNRRIVTFQPYGYSAFFADLTPHLKYGEDNIINITANVSAVPNTRWYTGAGIYRPLWLHVKEPVHIAHWGAVLSSTVDNGKAVVNCRVEVENHKTDTANPSVQAILYDAKNNCIATQNSMISINPDAAATACVQLACENPCLWSDESPYLYQIEIQLLDNGVIVDTQRIPWGIRTISFSAGKGFLLNGQPKKLKGGCVHHDCGILGAAAFSCAEERKVRLMKESGFNAVRCAHNPPSTAFLDACDRLGMLVINEAFDCWREIKTTHGYHMFFEDWWQRDMLAMLKRDRNHPSIILWSTGNEIVERDGHSDGNRYARELADFIREVDPTRAVTNAVNNIKPPLKSDGSPDDSIDANGHDHFAAITEKFIKPLDVAGYNYMPLRYEPDSKRFPDRIICATETFPKDALMYWEQVEKHDFVIGDFVWTAIDYIGEVGLGHVWVNGESGGLGGYPWRLANCGDIDLIGKKRPQSYYRDCVWGISTAPYIAVHDPNHTNKTHDMSPWGWPLVHPRWDWQGLEGKPVRVDVYSTADQVELLLNGKSIGVQNAGKENKYIASFETSYTAGCLTARNLKDGAEISKTELHTPGAPACLRLTPDKKQEPLKCGELLYVTVELADSDGHLLCASDKEISFNVCGNASFLAAGNANPVTTTNYTDYRQQLFEGRALVICRVNGDGGNITVTCTAQGVPQSSVTVTSVKRES